MSLESLIIASSAAFLALAYDPRDLNLYKVIGSDDVIEFLPEEEREESRYLAQTVNSLLASVCVCDLSLTIFDEKRILAVPSW